METFWYLMVLIRIQTEIIIYKRGTWLDINMHKWLEQDKRKTQKYKYECVSVKRKLLKCMQFLSEDLRKHAVVVQCKKNRMEAQSEKLTFIKSEILRK